MIKKIAKNIQPALGLTVGAVGAGYVSRFVPVENEKVKAAAPLVLGLILLSSGKAKGILGDVAAGMIAAGGKGLVNSFGIGFAPDPISYIDVDGGEGAGPEPINGMEDTLPEDEMPL